MANSSDEIKNLLAFANANGPINGTTQLQQALARLDATLSRRESQKVTEKSLIGR